MFKEEETGISSIIKYMMNPLKNAKKEKKSEVEGFGEAANLHVVRVVLHVGWGGKGGQDIQERGW